MIDLPFSVYIPDLTQPEQLAHSLAYGLPNQLLLQSVIACKVF